MQGRSHFRGQVGPDYEEDVQHRVAGRSQRQESGSREQPFQFRRAGGNIAFVDSGSQGKSITGAVDGAQLRSIWKSKSLPPTSFGFAHNLTPDLQRKVHEAFLTFDGAGSGLAKEFGRRADMFCTISYEETWESIRLMQKENGVVYKVSDP